MIEIYNIDIPFLLVNLFELLHVVPHFLFQE